jgi:hypothetical protein
MCMGECPNDRHSASATESVGRFALVDPPLPL